MHYKDPNTITKKSVTMFRILYVIANALYPVAWCLSTTIAEAVEDICLEPEYDEYNNAYYEDEIEAQVEKK